MDYKRKIIKAYPIYEVFIPLDNWEERSQVISYVRKDVGFNII